jgi:hypothetical protein
MFLHIRHDLEEWVQGRRAEDREGNCFASVHDLTTLRQAKILAPNVATVNCPVVAVQLAPAMAH